MSLSACGVRKCMAYIRLVSEFLKNSLSSKREYTECMWREGV